MCKLYLLYMHSICVTVAHRNWLTPMFTDCYCTQFRRSSRALTRLYDAALKDHGIRITQFSLLRALRRLGGLIRSSRGLLVLLWIRTASDPTDCGVVDILPCSR